MQFGLALVLFIATLSCYSSVRQKFASIFNEDVWIDEGESFVNDNINGDHGGVANSSSSSAAVATTEADHLLQQCKQLQETSRQDNNNRVTMDNSVVAEPIVAQQSLFSRSAARNAPFPCDKFRRAYVHPTLQWQLDLFVNRATHDSITDHHAAQVP